MSIIGLAAGILYVSSGINCWQVLASFPNSSTSPGTRLGCSCSMATSPMTSGPVGRGYPVGRR